MTDLQASYSWSYPHSIGVEAKDAECAVDSVQVLENRLDEAEIEAACKPSMNQTAFQRDHLHRDEEHRHHSYR